MYTVTQITGCITSGKAWEEIKLYDFTTVPQRLGSDCVKWDSSPKPGQLPMWVADMDFIAAPAITEALKKRAEQQIFGYSILGENYYQAVIHWMERRHHLHVEKDWIVFTPGVVVALNMAIRAISEPGDDILLCTPVYGPFKASVEATGRNPICSSLKKVEDFFTFDFEDMEARITPKTKAFMLCSPHNPVGRVWKKEELVALADFCQKHNLYVIADEIHNDLVFTPHTCFYNLSEDAAQRSILCTAPSKTFNLASIQASNIIIKNPDLRKKFKSCLENIHIGSPNAFVEAAVIAAYEQSESWLDELLPVLEGNCRYFCDEINQLPGLRASMPEGTYLIWLDCSGLGLNQEELHHFFYDTCNIYFNEGAIFGDEGKLYQRVNVACPRSIVEEAVKRMKEHLAK